MLRSNPNAGEASGDVIKRDFDPVTELRVRVFIRERLAHHIDPDVARKAIESVEAGMRSSDIETERAVKDAYKKVHALARHIKSDSEVREYSAVLKIIERQDPADINTLSRLAPRHVLEGLRALEEVGLLTSKRDGFYWSATDRGRDLAGLLRKVSEGLDKKDKAEMVAQEATDRKEEARKALFEYEAAIMGVKRVAPRMVELGIEDFRRPDTADLAGTFLDVLMKR